LADKRVRSDAQCFSLVRNAIAYKSFSYEKRLEYWRGKERPSRWPKLLAVLPYSDPQIEVFDFEEPEWRSLTAKPAATFGAELCHAQGFLYAVGGVQTKRVSPPSCQGSLGWIYQLPSNSKMLLKKGRKMPLLYSRWIVMISSEIAGPARASFHN